MRIVIFGCGPMPCEPQYAVTAPGARTWQIVQTVLAGLERADEANAEVVVVGMDEAGPRSAPLPLRFEVPVDCGSESADACPRRPVLYIPMAVADFKAIGQGKWPELLRQAPDAVVATGSAQPYATGAQYARAVERPLWVDVFGDPLTELQSRAELVPERKEENNTFFLHTAKLLLDALVQGDVFTALSTRQRFALIGHLGVVGRLNRLTACYEFVHPLPYGVFPATAPPLAQPRDHGYFVVLWCGSFNTWMDVETLAAGVVKAWRAYPRLRLLIAGGRCPGYNDVSFAQFAEAIRRENASELVRVVDWQPYGALEALYGEADVGLSIDRMTYEALLGSRTRLVHFLLAGKPVISTTPTELAEDLARAGFLLPFRVGDSDNLAEVLLEAAGRGPQAMAELGRKGRDYVLAHYHGRLLAAPLMEWIAAPQFAPDKSGPHHSLDPANPLTNYWQRVLDRERTF